VAIPPVSARNQAATDNDGACLQTEEIFEYALYCIFLPIDNQVMYLPQRLLELLRKSLSMTVASFESCLMKAIDSCTFEVCTCSITRKVLLLNSCFSRSLLFLWSNKQNLLATLQSQYQALEAHTYYSKTSFKTVDGWRYWLGSEQSRIRELISMVQTDNPGVVRRSYARDACVMCRSRGTARIRTRHLATEHNVPISASQVRSPTILPTAHSLVVCLRIFGA